MAILILALHLINIYCAGIVVGTWMMTLLAFIPLGRALAPGVSLQVQQTMDPLVDRYNRPCAAVGIAFGIFLLLLRHDFTTVSDLLLLVGTLALIGGAIVTIRFEFPINRTIQTWSVEAVPPEFGAVRERWNRFHIVRTVFGLVAFLCLIIAGLAR